ncbi:hypothetical protein CEXT_186321 [Caerostris extrusa]|uniref:Uncharacterized protein n=1 Tax=Caerostris extrusa TaxID=172846 RepID=A0AAV4XUA8_CAEEX|nr:hypothetical protein CEXT_186321 [Caerostris extrusa]
MFNYFAVTMPPGKKRDINYLGSDPALSPPYILDLAPAYRGLCFGHCVRIRACGVDEIFFCGGFTRLRYAPAQKKLGRRILSEEGESYF